MKKFIFSVLFLCTFSCFATVHVDPSLETCPPAPDVTDATFCVSFKSIAQCHCRLDGNLPADYCKKQTMNDIYNRMIRSFGTQEKACLWQEYNAAKETAPYQTCMDDWNCYRKGGKDSRGLLCNSTGKACQ